MSERRMGRVGALASLLAVLLGCGSEPDRAEVRVAAESRYRVDLRRAPGSDGELRLRLEPETGWHIVPEAAAHLRLVAPDGFAFAEPQQAGSDAVEHSEQALEFALTLKALDTNRAVAAPARAEVKFGLCRDDAQGCDIIRRKLELPLAWVTAAP